MKPFLCFKILLMLICPPNFACYAMDHYCRYGFNIVTSHPATEALVVYSEYDL